MLVQVQFRTGDAEAWRCVEVWVDRNSKFLSLKDAAHLMEDGSVIRHERVTFALGALVMWTEDQDRG